MESKPTRCRKYYADLKYFLICFGVVNLLTLLLNLFRTVEITALRRTIWCFWNKRDTRTYLIFFKVCFSPRKYGDFVSSTTAMQYRGFVLILWSAVIYSGFGGWRDVGFVSGLQPNSERLFKLNSLRDSLPNTRLRARRELSRLRPRGKYKYNLKKTAIRHARNRNALCLGKINKSLFKRGRSFCVLIRRVECTD